MIKAEFWGKKMCESIPLLFSTIGPTPSQIQSFYDPNVGLMKTLRINTAENGGFGHPSTVFQLRKSGDLLDVVVPETLRYILKPEESCSI